MVGAQQRTAAFLNLLVQHGARVVGIGLPPMKSSKYEDKTELINRIAYTVVSQYPQASWWNPQQSIADNTGAYREFATLANGRTTRIRAVDGIHLSDEGAALLTPTLMNWLNPSPPTLRNWRFRPHSLRPDRRGPSVAECPPLKE